MNETNRPIVRKRGSVRLLGEKGDQSLVQLLKATTIHREDLVKNGTNVSHDSAPACPKELSGEPIRARHFAERERFNNSPNLVLSKHSVLLREVNVTDSQSLQVQGEFSCHILAQQLFVSIVEGFLLSFLICDNTTVHMQRGDVILHTSPIRHQVKQLRVRIPLL